MRSVRGKSAVAFFHQPFFEYAAARAVLYSEDERTKEHTHRMVVEDLRESRLFRLPVLKQLAIQAYFAKDRIWPFWLPRIEVSEIQAAAKIALEVIGKLGATKNSSNVYFNGRSERRTCFRRSHPISCGLCWRQGAILFHNEIRYPAPLAAELAFHKRKRDIGETGAGKTARYRV